MTTLISSLHDDLLWPCVAHACGMGELNANGQRFPVGERSPLVRAAQFGVENANVWTSPPAGVAAYEGYCAALVPAVSRHYETVVAAIFDRYYTSDAGSGCPPAPPIMADMARSAREDLNRYLSFAGCGLPVARTANEMHENGPTNLVLAVEGMDFVDCEAQIEELIEAGVRIFALQYNRPNALTRGDCSEFEQPSELGLTELGQKMVARLFAAGVVLDLAHSAPTTRADILRFSEEHGYGKQTAYTHGAIFEEAEQERVTRLPGRFLHRAEARRVLAMGGIIGLTPARIFTPTLKSFAAQVSRLVCETANGAGCVALGTDFGGIWEGALLPEIQSVRDLPRIGDVLAEQHYFTGTQIDAVLRTNATRWLRQTLPKNG